MSEQRLRNLYLPPFKAAIDAGSDTVMCSFNAINGVPGLRATTSSRPTCSRGEWGFDGFIESDYTAVAELRACPPRTRTRARAATASRTTAPDAAAMALNAGTDSEMVSTLIRDYGKQLLAQGRISMRRIDDAVRRILRVKFRAGLFENPYVDPAQGRGRAAAARRRRGRTQGGRAARWCC